MALVLLALLCVGALSWALRLRDAGRVDTTRLSALPMKIGDWKGTALPIENSVEQMLNADFNIQRSYRHSTGAGAWLYLGYYGTRRGGRPEHTPWLCYPSNGWRILRKGVLEWNRKTGRRANELLIEKDGQRRLVLFWYRSYHRSGMLGGLDQTLERIRGRIFDGRGDGALVRVSTLLESGQEEALARSRLTSFADSLEPLLRRHWPSESGLPHAD